MTVKLPLIQLALDFPTIEQAIAAAQIGVLAGVDLLEAGTPLIVAQGVQVVGQLVRTFPEYAVLADYKTMDSGFRNVQLTHAQGGRYMTVCANAPDETIRSAIAEGKKTGVQVVVDTIGVQNTLQRVRQCTAWGIDMVYLHYGADQRRADPSQDSTQWLDDILKATSVPIGVATFGVEDAIVAAQKGAYLVAIGHPLVSAENAREQLTEYVRQVRGASECGGSNG